MTDSTIDPTSLKSNDSSSAPRIRVKFLTKAYRSSDWTHWLDRFPKRTPSWGACDFVFEPQEREYDWLAIYDDLPSVKGERFTLWEEHLACPKAHTLLITTEPSTIKVYGNAFLDQFGVVLTSQEPWVIPHAGAVYRQPGLLWYYGQSGQRGNFDEIAKNIPDAKTSDISTVCSTKKQTHTLHRSRFRFTKQLKDALPQLAVFGRGVRPIEDKADALDSYRYHVAIENHICRHHWTEKLPDCYLGLCLPFYHGCPNAADYFPEESFIPIDIRQVGQTIERIKQAIRDGEYAKRLPAIREARRRVVNHYHLFANLSGVIAERHESSRPTSSTESVILSRHAWRRKSIGNALVHGWEKVAVSLRHKFRKAPG